jgi:biopolymer transport protein ExbB/TolQ
MTPSSLAALEAVFDLLRKGGIVMVPLFLVGWWAWILVFAARPGAAHTIRTIKGLAAIAPMLGLLGTVMGMVDTFDTISRFGFGNPTLLADGISEALLTTQAGLLIAFPLLLACDFLERRKAKPLA